MGVFLLYCIQDWHSLRLLSGLNCDHCILCYVAVQTCLKKKKSNDLALLLQWCSLSQLVLFVFFLLLFRFICITNLKHYFLPK